MAENAAIAEVTKKVEEIVLEYVTNSHSHITTTQPTFAPLPTTTSLLDTLPYSLLTFIHSRLGGTGSDRSQPNASVASLSLTLTFYFLTLTLCPIIFLVFSEHGQPLSKNALKKLEKEKLKKERAEKDALARAAQAAAKASATVVRYSHLLGIRADRLVAALLLSFKP
jgi:hypothetical protein